MRHVEVSVIRHPSDRLDLTYRLSGLAGDVFVPAPATPIATDGLWRHTCCELFIAVGHGTEYEEFNFSPSGQWAHYRFNAYRERDFDFTPATAPLIHWQALADAYQLDVTLSADQLPASPSLQLGLSAVIEAGDGSKHYWALKHCAAQPDFHHRQSFTLALPESTT